MKYNGDNDNFSCSMLFENRFSNFFIILSCQTSDRNQRKTYCIQLCIDNHFETTRTREGEVI